MFEVKQRIIALEAMEKKGRETPNLYRQTMRRDKADDNAAPFYFGIGRGGGP